MNIYEEKHKPSIRKKAPFKNKYVCDIVFYIVESGEDPDEVKKWHERNIDFSITPDFTNKTFINSKIANSLLEVFDFIYKAIIKSQHSSTKVTFFRKPEDERIYIRVYTENTTLGRLEVMTTICILKRIRIWV
jgi:hypothetical protein